MQSDFLENDQNALSSVLPPATGSSSINVGRAERIASVVLGTAAAVYGLRKINSPVGIALTIASGFLLSRGTSGYCMVNKALGRNTNAVVKKTSAMEIQNTFIINKPKEEVYSFWRNLENLPLFMKHLQKVEEEDSVNSTWKAHIPGHVGTVTWKAVITEDIPNELIIWSSKPGSTIDNAGEVRFKERSDNTTELRIRMTYRLPAGDIGTLAGKLFSPAVEKMIQEDLQRFKSMMESGEFSAIETIGSTESVSLASEPLQSKTRKSKSTRKKSSAVGSEDDRTTDLPDPDFKTYEDNFMERD